MQNNPNNIFLARYFARHARLSKGYAPTARKEKPQTVKKTQNQQSFRPTHICTSVLYDPYTGLVRSIQGLCSLRTRPV